MISSQTLKSLEFDSVLEEISGFSKSEAAVTAILRITPMADREEIEKRSSEISEIRALTQEGNRLYISTFQNIETVFHDVRPDNAILDIARLISVKSVLFALSEVNYQLKDRDDLKYLSKLNDELTGFPDLLKMLNRSIGDDGEVLDGASPELGRIRKRKAKMIAEIKSKLTEITRDPAFSPFLQDDFITQRSGRWVIPVRMDSKGQVPGVMHAVSNTGETAFTEPFDIIGPSNKYENLIAEEKVEIIRIVKEICLKIRTILPELSTRFNRLVYLDLLRSIACFADAFDMERVKIKEGGPLQLFNAKHPLLMLQQKKGVIDKVEPLNLSLDEKANLLVISGPNAGGKTIALKTVGILLVMANCGMPIPADGSSSFPLISKIAVDIGDDQSLESSLSTFSAHVSKLSRIIRDADSLTMVLLDELGRGTEPLQGAAIACAVLSALQKKGALLFATTHLNDIVGYVHRTEGMVNGAMEFDDSSHSPLYKLKVGEPGLSHALDVAAKYGLPQEIISSAKEIMGDQGAEFLELVTKLKEKRAFYEQSLNDMERLKKELAEKERRIEAKMLSLEGEKERIKTQAYIDAKNITSRTKKKVLAILEQAKKEKKKKSLKDIEMERLHIEEKLREIGRNDSGERPPEMEKIKKGDIFFVRSIGFDAEVLKVDKKKKRITVRSGNLTLEVAARDLSKKRRKDVPEKKNRNNISNAKEENTESSTSIKLLGLRAEEAVREVDIFLDNAVLRGYREIRIIHGVGTGALIKAVRNHLKNHRQVSIFRPGELQEGGDGVTIVLT